MTSDTGPMLRFWIHRLLAREMMSFGKVLAAEQFDLIEWEHVLTALHEVLCLFQLWACKQVLGIAATNVLRSRWTEGLDPRCLSCKCRMEICEHVLYCNEAGCVVTLLLTIEIVQGWIQESGTDPELQFCMMQYAKA